MLQGPFGAAANTSGDNAFSSARAMQAGGRRWAAVAGSKAVRVLGPGGEAAGLQERQNAGIHVPGISA